MFKKKIVSFVSLLAALLISASPAFAHAVVKPPTAGVGSFTDFTLGVPSEKDAATVSVKLMLPAGLKNVSPIVKPGWKVEVKQAPDPSGQKDDDGNPAMVATEIDWTGGSVPAHQKDFFMFSAQVPATEGELDWKIEQLYSDGSVISWSKSADDQPKDSAGKPDFSKFGPYSKTMVVNDLKPSNPVAVGGAVVNNSGNTLPLLLSGLALILSVVSLWKVSRK